MLGKDVAVEGEVSKPEQTYTKELIHKLAKMIQIPFKSEIK
jgi:hypothetical protein